MGRKEAEHRGYWYSSELCQEDGSCPCGFECLEDACPNWELCVEYTKAWPLPYKSRLPGCSIFVNSLFDTYHLQSQQDEVSAAGYAASCYLPAELQGQLEAVSAAAAGRACISSIPAHLENLVIQTSKEVMRLKLNIGQGPELLQALTGKRSRLLCTEEELLNFLHALQAIPTPDS